MMKEYTAEMFGSQWATGPVATFNRIRDARAWAEEYGTTADRCVIYCNRKRVAVHARNKQGSGTGWYRASV